MTQADTLDTQTETFEGAALAEIIRNCKEDFDGTWDEPSGGSTGRGTAERDRLIVELLEAHARSAEAGLSASIIRLHVAGAASRAVAAPGLTHDQRRALIEVAHTFHMMSMEGFIA